VIGMEKETALRRFMLATPQKYQGAEGDNRICAILADVRVEDGQCVRMEPLILPSFRSESA
jgi:2',3'-cyclic-nucleotide 2'-phosphodiesterase